MVLNTFIRDWKGHKPLCGNPFATAAANIMGSPSLEVSFGSLGMEELSESGSDEPN